MTLRRILPLHVREPWRLMNRYRDAVKVPSRDERLARLQAIQNAKVYGAQMRDPLMKRLVRDGLVRLHRPSNAEYYNKGWLSSFQKATQARLTPAGEAFLADPTARHVPKSERTEKAKGVRGK